MDEGYVAERVRAFEGIFNQHWIPIERVYPPEPIRDFLSRSSLRPFPPLHQNARPSSSLSSTYVSVEATPRQTQVRHLSQRRIKTFTSSLSEPQTPMLATTSTPSRQVMSEEQRKKIHQYLAHTEMEDEDSKFSIVPHQKVRGMVAPYIHSPTRTRPGSRMDGSRVLNEHTDMTSKQPVLFDPQPRASYQISFPTVQTCATEVQSLQKSGALGDARSVIDGKIPRLLPRRSIAERLGDLLDETAELHNGRSGSQATASESPLKNKYLLGTPAPSHPCLASEASNVTPGSTNSTERTPSTIGRLPKDVWPPSHEAPKGSPSLRGLEYSPATTPVRALMPRKLDQSIAQGMTTSRDGGKHRKPQRPASSFGIYPRERPSPNLSLRHRASTLPPCETQSNTQHHLRTFTTIGPSTSRRVIEATDSNSSQPSRKAELPADCENSKMRIWSLNRSRHQSERPSVLRMPIQRPAKLRRPFEDEPLDFAKAPLPAKVAVFENAIPVLSTEPSTSLVMGSNNSQSNYIGHASRKLQQDLHRLSIDNEASKVEKGLSSSGPLDGQRVRAIEGQASSPFYEAESFDGLLSQLPLVKQCENSRHSGDTDDIVKTPDAMSSHMERSPETSPIRHNFVTSQTTTSSIKVPSTKRTASVSRLLKRVSAWKLVLVDKSGSEKKTEEVPRQASVPASEVASTSEEYVKNYSGKSNALDRISMLSERTERILNPQKEEEEGLSAEEMLKDTPESPRRLRSWIVALETGRGHTVQLSSEPDGPEGAIIEDPRPSKLKLVDSKSSPKATVHRDLECFAAAPEDASTLRSPNAADREDGLLSTSAISPKPSTSGQALPTAINRNGVSDPLESHSPKLSRGSTPQTTPKAPPKTLVTPVGFRRIRPSDSWIKDSPRKSPERLLYSSSHPTVRDTIEMDASGARSISSAASAAAESAPKVGSLAALTYLKNCTGNARRQPRPSVSVKVLPTSSTGFEYADDENLPDENHTSEESDDRGTAESPSSSSSRVSMLMRRGGAKGQRVKKVSVLVSLDGPADLRIDASVRKRRLGRLGWGNVASRTKEKVVEKGEGKFMAQG